jgi:XTP/dITP diphosphohydrolase
MGNDRAKARCKLQFRHPEYVLNGEGSVSGRLVSPPRGPHGFGWDPVFQPDGTDLTFGELSDESKDRISHRGGAWRDLLRRCGDPRSHPSRREGP